MTEISRVPLRRFYGESMQTLLHSLYISMERSNQVLDSENWTGRRVLGFKLPDWQRESVWTDDQCRYFIESVYYGANISSYMVNQTLEPDLNNVLVDGQQRMRALERYWNNEISVVGEDGNAWFWGDLDQTDQARLLRITFPFILTRYEQEAQLREAYNRHNFSGTAHLDHERAPDAEGYRSVTPGRTPI